MGIERSRVQPCTPFMAASLTACFVSFSTLCFSQPEEDYVLVLSTANVGDPLEVVASFNFEDGEDVEGYEFGVCHDDEYLSLADGDVVDATDLEDLNPPRYLRVYDDDGAAGWVCAAIGNFTTGSVIPADNYDLYCVFYERLETDEVETTIEFCGTLGDPTIPVTFVIDGNDHDPTLEDLTVDLTIGSFLRGDIDTNGSVTALTDALFLLRWSFASGDPPQCMDATDVDDNGSLNTLVDSLYLLQYSFQYGDDPPDPGIDECGWDPTADEIDCEGKSDGCE